ncbi:bifunctional diguanylate cyclase/phosphodiesterase [Ferrimonas senticii]|uniref:bifunctional diguanylate cyclase/phosphodiesterase n=1 Tax=Ferrimonas senticii TaxID=394566 RepID=UPI0004010603|nr:EAL domain-containing protein [Ferrimonas senticii]
MTLYKQLSSLIFLVFGLVVLGLSLGQLREARQFIDAQMQSELNNSSQALTLMLQPAMEQADKVAAQTMITALFETGLYQSITLHWLADGEQQQWQRPAGQDSVPQWFQQLPLFQPRSQTSTIVSGWLQLGELTVTSHRGLAYQQIWSSLWITLLITSAMLLLMLTLAKWWLRHLLRPLEQIRVRAGKIAARQFEAPAIQPKAKELAELVASLNQMERKLQQQFLDHQQLVSQLQQQLLTDAISGLPNRQHLNQRLDSWLDSHGTGALLLLQLPLLQQLKQQFGYQLRDELLQQFVRQLRPLAKQHHVTLFRINYHELAVLAENIGSHGQQLLADDLVSQLQQLEQSCGLAKPKPSAIGAVSRQPQHQRQQLLADADQALTQAQQQHSPLCWFAELTEEPLSHHQWRTLLSGDLAPLLRLYRQPVLAQGTHHCVHYELFTRLDHAGQEYRAEQFLPYLQLTDATIAFDQLVIRTVLAQLANAPNGQLPYALNLSAAAVNQPSFGQWLLSQLRGQHYPVQFEVSEAAALHCSDALLTLRRQLAEAGYRCGIDHFGRELTSLDYLSQLRPDYLRLDLSFVCSASDSSHTLAQALCLTASGLEIEVYLTGVEHTAQLPRWQEVPLAGYQGFIAPPEPFEMATVQPQSEDASSATT